MASVNGARSRLRALREERGWTQEEVAEQVSRLAWLRQQKHVGVNADMVSKWERSKKRPEARYRDLPCLLFETDVHTLGFGGPSPADDSAARLTGLAILTAMTGTALFSRRDLTGT